MITRIRLLMAWSLCVSVLASAFPFDAFSLGPQGDPLIIISIPKAGTHLLMNCVRLLTGKYKTSRYEGRRIKFETVNMPTPAYLHTLSTLFSREYRVLHMPYSNERATVLREKNAKILFIIRDPRDQLASRVHYMKAGKCPAFKYKDMTFDALLTSYIGQPWCEGQLHIGMQSWVFERNKNPSCLCNIRQMYEEFLPWSAEESCYTVRFEDLVGSRGGGSDERQAQVIEEIAHHLGVRLSEQQRADVVTRLYGNTATFREGKIGTWKECFSPEHKTLFKAVAPGLLKKLGYEQDDNW